MKRLVRQVDIANALGVSQRIVSSVFNTNRQSTTRISPEMRTKILKQAAEMGYTVNLSARQLRGMSSRTFGVLVNNYYTQENYELLFLIGEAANRRGYRILTGQVMDDLEGISQYFDDFQSRAVEAVVCLFHEPYFDGRYHSIHDCVNPGQKVVFLGRPEGFPQASYVELDYVAAYAEAVEHLSGLGRKKIAFVAPNRIHANMRARFEGYRRGLEACSLAHDERLSQSFADELFQQETDQAMTGALDGVLVRMLEAGADAFLASNDSLASQIIRFAHVRGLRIPDDFSVVGFGNLQPLSVRLYPQLTSFNVRNAAVAETLVEMCLPEAGSDLRRRIRPSLVPRESTVGFRA